MSALPPCLKDSKCILHIDLDCFFCQVEEVRLGLDSSKPVAVQQWSSLIAVNYAARAFGVTRHCSVDEAKKLCPEITLVHVATYAPNETTAQYHKNPIRSTHKVSLDSYRDAGKKIFKIFNQHCSIIQKVGTDEAFLDVTEIVNNQLCNDYLPAHPILLDHLETDGDSTAILHDFSVDWIKVNNLVESADEIGRKDDLIRQHGIIDTDHDSTFRDPTSWFDIQLAIASEIAAAIRKHVFDELHYTCSAGISHNKVLAKLGSSRNKPNKQTVIRQHVALQFMEDVPFNKIRNLGGKFGHAVENEYNIQKASDLWKYNMDELQQKFGESSGLWLYNIVRGIDNEQVIILKAPKSLMASKSIRPPIKNSKDLLPWYAVLSGELHSRVMTNWNEHHSWPRTLSISYRTSNHPNTQSRSTAMLRKSEFETSEKLRQKVASMFSEVHDDLFPLTLMAIQATGLAPDASVTNHTINRFFRAPGSASVTPLLSNKTDTNSANSDNENNKKDQTNLRSSKPASPSLEHFFTNQTRNKPINPASHSPKPSTLVHFFTKPDRKLNNADLPYPTSITTWTCDQCHQPVPLEEVDEHTDYHFAEELAKDGNDTGTMYPHHGATLTGKRKECQDSDGSGKKTKRHFFEPSSS